MVGLVEGTIEVSIGKVNGAAVGDINGTLFGQMVLMRSKEVSIVRKNHSCKQIVLHSQHLLSKGLT